jgi:hypothetical protein
MTRSFRALRHRFAKAVVVWFLRHSGTGALVEAEAAETTALLNGFRQDMEATQNMLRVAARQIGFLGDVKAEWEKADKRLFQATRRVIARRERADRAINGATRGIRKPIPAKESQPSLILPLQSEDVQA